MAQLADSEAVLWRQAEKIRHQEQECLNLKKVIAVLARRQGGVLIIKPEDLMQLPSGAWIDSEFRGDGTIVIRVREPGGQAGEPGITS